MWLTHILVGYLVWSDTNPFTYLPKIPKIGIGIDNDVLFPNLLWCI